MTRAEIQRDGHSNRTIANLLATGEIFRPRQGLYRLQDSAPIGEFTFVEACRIAPRGVVCLTSALSHYGLTTQIPKEVELAIPPGNANQPSRDIAIRYVEMPNRLLQRDVVRVEAVTNGFYRIFSPERSVCDAFRYRNVTGEDVAYEALGALLRRKFDRKKLFDSAHATKTEAFILPPLRTLGM